MRRRLSPEENALWARVTETIRPLDERRGTFPAQPHCPPHSAPSPLPPRALAGPKPTPRPALPGRAATPANTLDGGWDRRLSAGRVAPDSTLDLHGHSLASAHALLERRLGEAITRGDRVMLLITGKPPSPHPHARHERPRGLIRQQLPLWIASSPFQGAIAAVRGAHPRHGGQGALYLIFRRPREQAGR